VGAKLIQLIEENIKTNASLSDSENKLAVQCGTYQVRLLRTQTSSCGHPVTTSEPTHGSKLPTPDVPILTSKIAVNPECRWLLDPKFKQIMRSHQHAIALKLGDQLLGISRQPTNKRSKPMSGEATTITGAVLADEVGTGKVSYSA
jgi:hypothetical protein